MFLCMPQLNEILYSVKQKPVNSSIAYLIIYLNDNYFYIILFVLLFGNNITFMLDWLI